VHVMVRLGVALIIAALYGNAVAQTPAANVPARKKPDSHFARLDANNDGFLSYQEARGERDTARQFALFDENRDGRLSEDEFLKLKAAQARHRDSTTISDGVIKSKVKLAVMRAKDLKSADVHVETIAGVVRLDGEVDNAKQAARAAQLAGRIKGVKKVENNLTVRPEHK